MRTFISLIITLICLSGTAGPDHCDSLFSNIRGSKGEQKLELSIAYYNQTQCDDRRDRLVDAFQYGQEINSQSPVYANILLEMAYSAGQNGFADSCDRLFEEAKQLIGIEAEDKLGFLYNRYFGLTHSFRGDVEMALEYLHKAMDISLEMKDTVYTSMIYSDIAIPQYVVGNYEAAIKHWLKAAALDAAVMDYDGCYSSWLNCGLAFSQNNQLDSATKYMQQALDIYQQRNLDVDMINLNMNIGVLHYQKGEYQEAIRYFEKTADLAFAKGDDASYGKAISNITSTYTELGQPEKGINYALEALEISKKGSDLSFMINIYRIISDNYAGLNDYKQAWLYQDSLRMFRDSLQSIERGNYLTEMEEKYQSVQKDIQIAENEVTIANERLQTAQERQEKELLNTIIIFVVIALIILLSLIVVILRGYQQKRKSANLLREQKDIIEQKNKDITDSITYAKNLQDSILPKASEIAKHLPNYMIYFQPRDIVSGDFYWFNENDTHTFIAAADCTGHGVPGAFVSMMCYNQLNRTINEMGLVHPGEILTAVSCNIINEFKNKLSRYQSNDGMDIALVSINKQTREIEFAGAMNSLLQFRGSDLIEYKADRRSIGGETSLDYCFETRKVMAQEKDVFYLFSDGYQDQFGGPKGKKFMSKNFKRLLQEIKDLKAEKQRAILEETLNDWRGNFEQIDDILILGFEV